MDASCEKHQLLPPLRSLVVWKQREEEEEEEDGGGGVQTEVLKGGRGGALDIQSCL